MQTEPSDAPRNGNSNTIHAERWEGQTGERLGPEILRISRNLTGYGRLEKQQAFREGSVQGQEKSDKMLRVKHRENKTSQHTHTYS